MINNTLNIAHKLLENYKSPLLEEYSFSTYSGETNDVEALREADILYYKDLKIKLGLELMDDDEFSEYCDDNEHWESAPSNIRYEKIKKTNTVYC